MIKKRKFKFSSLPNSLYVLAIVFILSSVLVKNFFSPGNLSNLILQSSILMLLSFGMSLVIMTGGVDLSVGGILSLTGVTMALLLKNGNNAIVAILVGLLVGILFGILNGFLVAKVKIAPFISTFAMMGIAQSLANVFAGSRTVYWDEMPQNELMDKLGGNLFQISFGSEAKNVLSIPFIVVITTICLAAVIIIFKKTSFGNYIYAVGENEEVARLSGIKTVSFKILVFAISGFLAAVAGLMIIIRTECMQPTLGSGYEFQAVVASVIGGNSLRGGKGSLTGTILGALALFSVRSALTLEGISTSVVMIVIGAVLILGMVMNEFVNKLDDKRLLSDRNI